MSAESFRNTLTPDQRAYPLVPYIDPGFLNHRLVETFVGQKGMDVIRRMIAEIPAHTPAGIRRVQVDHVYTRVALHLCESLNVPSLGQAVCSGEFQPGQVVCSTENLEGTPDVYDKERALVRWTPHIEPPWEVVFELSTGHIFSDTCRDDLSKRSLLSFIAHLVRVDGARAYFAPLIIGRPWLKEPPAGAPFETIWLHYDFFEHYIEDIDEFQEVRDVPHDLDWSPMGVISEQALKECLCRILGDAVKKDWGGETSDHVTSHLHVRGRRLTAAFLLKGPGSGFTEMEMTHLGKRGDQLYRLACEPAEMLIVQHCHDIGSAVRATVRAFAVQPSRARRYCFIDGRDSFRVLAAYDLAEEAVRLSTEKS